MKKLFTYLKSLFSKKLENVEIATEKANTGEEINNSELVDVQVTDAVTQSTKEIEERLVEVAKEEKPLTAKQIKAKASKPKTTKPKAEIEISKEDAPKKATRKRAPRKPAAKKPE
jgi:hypothetical protein